MHNMRFVYNLQKKTPSPIKRERTDGEQSAAAKRKLIFTSSPKKEMYYDRMIPSLTAANLEASFSLLPAQNSDGENTKPTPSLQDSNSAVRALYIQILQNELLGTSNVVEEYSKTPPLTGKGVPRAINSSGMVPSDPNNQSPTRLLSFKSKKQATFSDSPYSLSPISVQSQQLLSSPKKNSKKNSQSSL